MSEFYLKTAVLLVAYVSRILGLSDWETSVNENCTSIRCSNYEEPVCGFLHKRYSDLKARSQFQNLCHLNRHLCLEPNDFWISTPCETPSGRRQADLSITGATNIFCNHSCPTVCPEFYDPVCMRSGRQYIPIVNHCSVDMYSCTSGNNVSLAPFYNCYKNRPWIPFALTAKVMKNLQLLKPKMVKEGLEHFNPKEEIYAETPKMIYRRSFLWSPGDERREKSVQLDEGQDVNEGFQLEGHEMRSKSYGNIKEVNLFSVISETV